MRVGIFYLSKFSGRKGERQAIRLPGGGQVWVRVEEVEAGGTSEALDRAELRPNETLMNTHRLPDPAQEEE